MPPAEFKISLMIQRVAWPAVALITTKCGSQDYKKNTATIPR